MVARERLQLQREVYELCTYVLRLHMDYMQARSQPSIAPIFRQSDKLSIVSKRLFLRGQQNRKLKDRYLLVLEKIGIGSYKIGLPYNVYVHPVLHVNNLHISPTTILRPSLLVTTTEGNDEYDITNISAIKIETVPCEDII
jgi:hypothetical protein